MIIAGSDIETTGLDAEKGHRIIEVHVSLWDFKARHKMSAETWRIHPQRSIDPGAQAVHKISLLDLAGCPVWDHDLADVIKTRLDMADLLVFHNGDHFDVPFLNHEFRRVGVKEIAKPTFDTMLEGRFATPVGIVPNLGALCWACDVDYDPEKAHAADYDVDKMMECFFKAFAWGWFKHKLLDTRSCTCHPDDNPPVPCARKYALTECVAARDAA